MTSDSADHAYLKRALDIAVDHMRSGEGKPFGAIVVRDGKPLAEGWNSVYASKDATAHAELMAIRRACKVAGSPDLSGSTVYASGEPCPMCLGAMYLANVERCVYATTKEDAVRIGGTLHLLYPEFALPPGERSLPCIHLPIAEAQAAFDEFLAAAR